MEDNYKSLDEFEFWLDSSMNWGVSCPRVCEKSMYNLVSTLAPSFLIGSSSFLQIRRTTIISRTSLNFGTIQPRTAELAVLEHLNNHKSLDAFEFRPNSTIDCGVSCP